MSLFSFHYLIFCAVLVLAYARRSSGRYRRGLLTLANLVFLLPCLASPESGAALLGFVGVSYAALLAIRRWQRLPVLPLGIACAVFGLALVKRYHFLAWLLPDLWLSHALELVGISYMVFKWIHAAVDLRQGQLAALGFSTYANYQLGFFSLLAGPIQRYNDFEAFWSSGLERVVPQREGLLAWRRVVTGMLKLGVFGALAHLVYSEGKDAIAAASTSQEALLGLAGLFYGYPIYMYLNFSGYSDIVIGSARMLGMEQQENFDRPWLARDLIEFWNRWHISLTLWIRDYVFMTSFKFAAERWPKRARGFGYLLLGLALFLAGVWHGPSLNFVAFGLLHGVGVAAARIYADLLRRRLGHAGLRSYLTAPWIRRVAIGVTLHYVAFCFLFFTPGLRAALELLRLAWSKIL